MKVAIVTGGDSGIGRAIAMHYAREGAHIAIAYLDEHEDAEQIKKHIEESKVECILIPGDISKEETCQCVKVLLLLTAHCLHAMHWENK